jgi:hypothetical protein
MKTDIRLSIFSITFSAALKITSVQKAAENAGNRRSSTHTGQLFYYVAARKNAYGQASRGRAE